MKQGRSAKWETDQPTIGKGVIVACDQPYEIYLPWWWHNFSLHSSLPVAFIDLGLSKGAQAYCSSKGLVIPHHPDSSFQAKKEEIDANLANYWELYHGSDLWEKRAAWFAKPFYLLKTPFKRTLFLDIDCRVQGNIDPLLEIDSSDQFATMKHIFPEGTFYNSGVCAFGWGSPVIPTWANRSFGVTHKELGDDDILHAILSEEQFDISFFPLKYNCPHSHELSDSAVIAHYLGKNGKNKILLERKGLK